MSTRVVHLHGALGAEFGKKISLAVETVPEAIEALMANFPSFASKIRNGFYRIVVGKTLKNGFELEAHQLLGFKLGNQELHLVPVVEGAKRGGLGKIIAGIALIGLSAMTGGAAGAIVGQTLWAGTTVGSLAASIGTSMLLTGVASMIAPEATSDDESNQSFVMSGPVNNTREGSIVPIVYGEVYTGGVMISGGATVSTKEVSND